MSQHEAEEVLARIQASPGRRVLGVGSMAGMGFMLLAVAVTTPPANPAWLAFLIVIGALALWLADAMRRATALSLDLTRDGIVCSDGETVASMEEIESLDRGLFAFKPSNGFLMKLSTKRPSRWRPGLWWRVGMRVGIGGVTAAAQAKAMAEMIAAVQFENNRERGD